MNLRNIGISDASAINDQLPFGSSPCFCYERDNRELSCGDEFELLANSDGFFKGRSSGDHLCKMWYPVVVSSNPAFNPTVVRDAIIWSRSTSVDFLNVAVLVDVRSDSVSHLDNILFISVDEVVSVDCDESSSI